MKNRGKFGYAIINLSLIFTPEKYTLLRCEREDEASRRDSLRAEQDV